MTQAAKLVQFALYALLIAIPATAVLGTWLVGIPVTLLGFDIAPQIAQAHRPGQLIMEIHTTLGNAILWRSEEHTSELQSLMRISYAVFCLKKNKTQLNTSINISH